MDTLGLPASSEGHVCTAGVHSSCREGLNLGAELFGGLYRYPQHTHRPADAAMSVYSCSFLLRYLHTEDTSIVTLNNRCMPGSATARCAVV